MTLYSYKLQYPKPLPHRIKLSNGRTRTDSSSFTVQEIEDAGYTVAPDKPVVNAWENLNWTGASWAVSDKPADQLKAKKELQINALREQRIYTQKTVILSTGQAIPIDVRQNKPDIQNLTNIVQKASLKVMRNETDSMIFKAADNQTYTLAPEEAIEMGENVFAQIENEYAQSWIKKAQLEALTTAQEVYEFDIRWGIIEEVEEANTAPIDEV
jgi:hypothetical protein